MVVMMGWGITFGAMEIPIEDHSVEVLDMVMVCGRRQIMLEIPMRGSTLMTSDVERVYLGGRVVESTRENSLMILGMGMERCIY